MHILESLPFKCLIITYYDETHEKINRFVFKRLNKTSGRDSIKNMLYLECVVYVII